LTYTAISNQFTKKENQKSTTKETAEYIKTHRG
jgi:hypothetical protein